MDSAINEVKNAAYARLGGGSGGSGGSQSSGKSEVVTLTDANFEQLVLKSKDLWLVEFYAPWCGHCKNLEPHYKAAAAQLKGKVKVSCKYMSLIN